MHAKHSPVAGVLQARPSGVAAGGMGRFAAGLLVVISGLGLGAAPAWSAGADLFADVPARAIGEGEPQCYDDYVDTFNGGCASEPPAFSWVPANEVIVGLSGTYLMHDRCPGDANCDGWVDFADINAFVNAVVGGEFCDGTGVNADITRDGPPHVGFEDINGFVALLTRGELPIACPVLQVQRVRDADWYAVTVTEPQQFTWSVLAEFDPAVAIMAAGPNGCPDAWSVLPECGWVTGPADVNLSVATRCLPAGTYYFMVTPVAVEGVECGRMYVAWLQATACERCTRACDPNDPGYQLENEPCGADVNAGCGQVADPNDDAFTEITFVESPPGSGMFFATVCATAWSDCDPATGEIRADEDWYRYYARGGVDVWVEVRTELPLYVCPLFGSEGEEPWACGAPEPGCWSGYNEPCNEVAPYQTWLPSGWNTLVVRAAEQSAPHAYGGYPCASSDNQYVLYLYYEEPRCDELIDCASMPEIQENEPTCHDGYVDNYNGGCDVVPPQAMVPLPGYGECEWYVCGTSGAYHETADPNSPFVCDADWYTFALSAAHVVCIEGLTELPLDAAIWGPDPTCADVAAGTKPMFEYAYAACADYVELMIDPDPNTPTVEPCPAGTYWLRAALRPGFEDLTCDLGWEYYLTLRCDEYCQPMK